ncbi:MAG: hypothetical protein KA914_03865 [Ottowia sp.]|jgi:hypothetical protein|nr:hypothetical protein [Ottowia sp.]
MPLSDDQALTLHIEAVHYEAQAAVCAMHFSIMAVPLQDAYAKWRAAHAAALQEGAAAAARRGMNGPKPPSLADMASMQAQLLGALPQDDMQRRCNELLASAALPK